LREETNEERGLFILRMGGTEEGTWEARLSFGITMKIEPTVKAEQTILFIAQTIGYSHSGCSLRLKETVIV